MDALQVVTMLSRGLSDTSIFTDILELKKCLTEIDEADLNTLYEKYPQLKNIIESLIKKLY